MRPPPDHRLHTRRTRALQLVLRGVAALLLGTAIWLHGLWKGRQDVIPYQLELRESLVRARFCGLLGKDCQTTLAVQFKEPGGRS